MNTAYIVETSLVTALGRSLEETWEGLCAGRSAAGRIERFSTDRLEYHTAATISTQDEGHQNITIQLMRKSLSQLRKIPPDTFVIWTGIKGDVHYIENLAKGTPGGALYLPKDYREWICRFLGIENRGMEINAACASSTVGICLAAHMIERGEQAGVLVCGADIVSRFTFTGFAALKALTPTICRPFDVRRDGLILGDGAGAVLLMNEEKARSLAYSPLAKVSGWGISNDATHITAPARDGCGLIQAIHSALAQAKMRPENLEAYCAHGTGTIYNDAMELTALKEIFGEKILPIFSVKGGIGHTLGAAGVIEAALSLKALQEEKVPGTIGLENPEERAGGRASPGPQTFAGRTILKANSGFGGVNAALIFERI